MDMTGFYKRLRFSDYEFFVSFFLEMLGMVLYNRGGYWGFDAGL